MTDVVICSCNEDVGVAATVGDALSRRGYAVWRDEAPDDDFWNSDAVLDRIKLAKAAIVIWSRDASASALFRAQANAARQQKKLVQLSADGSMPPFPFDEAPLADISDWRGQSHHPGWRQATAGIATLAGATAGELSHPSFPNLLDLVRSRLRRDPRPERPRRSASLFASPIPGLKAGLAASIALVTAAAAAGWVADRPRTAPAAKPVAAVETIPARPVVRAEPPVAPPVPKAETFAAHSVQPPAPAPKPPVEAAENPLKAESAKAEKSVGAKVAKTAGSRALATKHAGKARRPRAAAPKIKYKYSENMQLFCERAGQGTPQCRVFRRNVRKRPAPSVRASGPAAGPMPAS
jgi:hypothetical protein